MIRIDIPGSEFFNEETSEFIDVEPETVYLEHSLASISKWESKWHKPFLSTEKLTNQEVMSYIECMCLSNDVNETLVQRMTSESIKEIEEYMADQATATWFNETETPSREIITSEILYYQMIKLGIPFECENWHINRLVTLIRVCAIKGNSQNKMSKDQILQRNRELNEARKAKMKTKG